jgi:hypothetical protein
VWSCSYEEEVGQIYIEDILRVVCVCTALSVAETR